MREHLSVFQKGLILVAVPLVFQLGFIGVIWKARADAAAAQRFYAHSREVVAAAEGSLRTLAEAHSAVRGYVVTADPSFLAEYTRAAERLPSRMTELRRMVRDDPGQARQAAAIGTQVAGLLDWLGETARIVEQEGREAAVERVRSRAGLRRMADIRKSIERLLAEEAKTGKQRRADFARAATQLNKVLAGDAIVAVAAAVAGAWFFSRAITGRIAHVTDNIRRLAEGRELAAPLWGRDELAQLDGAFRAMAASLDAARSRERGYAASLEQRTAALEGANRELQNFASVASHDLQEPLRKIQAFGDRLRDRFGEGLGEQGLDYLERMRNAASRMRTLIDDLLTFSRLQTRAKPFEQVDLARISREVVSDLEGRIEQSGGRVELGELPTLEADASQMRQLLQNLIANALKFRRPEEPPLVRVDARRVAGSGGNGAALPGGPPWEIMVRDNGIGFEEKYLDRIFDVFQRLHGRGEFEGTGMGLAICRRIVIRHGGSITARSTPGSGATFVVTLPDRQPAEPEESEEL